MKKSKKLLAILLSVLLVVAVMAGCQNSQTTSSQAESKADASSAAGTSSEEAPAEHYTYRLARRLSGPPDKNSEMEVYWEERLDCDFEIIYFEVANYTELLNLELAGDAKNVPDVFSTQNSQKSSLLEYQKQGYLGGFTREFFQENAPLIYKSVEANGGELAFKMATIDGMMYSIPNVNPEAIPSPPVVWNMNWLEKVGFTNGTPKTLDEAVEVLYKFVNDDPDGNGKKDTYGMSNTSFDMIYGAFGVGRGAWLEQSDGTIAYDICQEGAKDALELLAKLYKDGVIDPEFITGENNGGYWAISHAFAEERIGVSGMGSFYHWVTPEGEEMGADIAGTPEIIKETNPDLKFGFGNHPSGPDGKYGRVAGNPAQVNTMFSKAFVEDEARFKRFLQICEVMSGYQDPEDCVISYRGIKGTDWDYDSKGNPVSKEGHTGNEYLWAHGAGGMMAIFYSADGFKLHNKARFDWGEKAYEGLQLNSYISVLLDVPASQADYKSELDTLLNEAVVSIITGEKPIDYYDEVMEKFNQMGGETWTKEANELYNASK